MKIRRNDWSDVLWRELSFKLTIPPQANVSCLTLAYAVQHGLAESACRQLLETIVADGLRRVMVALEGDSPRFWTRTEAQLKTWMSETVAADLRTRLEARVGHEIGGDTTTLKPALKAALTAHGVHKKQQRKVISATNDVLSSWLTDPSGRFTTWARKQLKEKEPCAALSAQAFSSLYQVIFAEMTRRTRALTRSVQADMVFELVTTTTVPASELAKSLTMRLVSAMCRGEVADSEGFFPELLAYLETPQAIALTEMYTPLREVFLELEKSFDRATADHELNKRHRRAFFLTLVGPHASALRLLMLSLVNYELQAMRDPVHFGEVITALPAAQRGHNVADFTDLVRRMLRGWPVVDRPPVVDLPDGEQSEGLLQVFTSAMTKSLSAWLVLRDNETFAEDGHQAVDVLKVLWKEFPKVARAALQTEWRRGYELFDALVVDVATHDTRHPSVVDDLVRRMQGRAAWIRHYKVNNVPAYAMLARLTGEEDQYRDLATTAGEDIDRFVAWATAVPSAGDSTDWVARLKVSLTTDKDDNTPAMAAHFSSDLSVRDGGRERLGRLAEHYRRFYPLAAALESDGRQPQQIFRAVLTGAATSVSIEQIMLTALAPDATLSPIVGQHAAPFIRQVADRLNGARLSSAAPVALTLDEVAKAYLAEAAGVEAMNKAQWRPARIVAGADAKGRLYEAAMKLSGFKFIDKLGNATGTKHTPPDAQTALQLRLTPDRRQLAAGCASLTSFYRKGYAERNRPHVLVYPRFVAAAGPACLTAHAFSAALLEEGLRADHVVVTPAEVVADSDAKSAIDADYRAFCSHAAPHAGDDTYMLPALWAHRWGAAAPLFEKKENEARWDALVTTVADYQSGELDGRAREVLGAAEVDWVVHWPVAGVKATNALQERYETIRDAPMVSARKVTPILSEAFKEITCAVHSHSFLSDPKEFWTWMWNDVLCSKLQQLGLVHHAARSAVAAHVFASHEPGRATSYRDIHRYEPRPFGARRAAHAVGGVHQPWAATTSHAEDVPLVKPVDPHDPIAYLTEDAIMVEGHPDFSAALQWLAQTSPPFKQPETQRVPTASAVAIPTRAYVKFVKDWYRDSRAGQAVRAAFEAGCRRYYAEFAPSLALSVEPLEGDDSATVAAALEKALQYTAQVAANEEQRSYAEFRKSLERVIVVSVAAHRAQLEFVTALALPGAWLIICELDSPLDELHCATIAAAMHLLDGTGFRASIDRNYQQNPARARRRALEPAEVTSAGMTPVTRQVAVHRDRLVMTPAVALPRRERQAHVKDVRRVRAEQMTGWTAADALLHLTSSLLIRRRCAEAVPSATDSLKHLKKKKNVFLHAFHPDKVEDITEELVAQLRDGILAFDILVDAKQEQTQTDS